MKPRAFSWIRLKALVKKEFIHILRDPRSLAMAFLMPLILLILFGYAITMDIKTLDLAVYDQDRSAASRQYLEGFPASSYFTVVASVDSYAAAREQIDRGDAQLALVIPPHFARDLEQGRSTRVQLLAEAIDQGYADAYRQFIEPVVGAADPMWRGGLSASNSLFLHADRPLISENGTSTLVHELTHVITRVRGADGDVSVLDLARAVDPFPDS